MPQLPVDQVRAAAAEGRVEWSRHVLERMAARNLALAVVKEALQTGEIIEEYPEDEPYPSGLFLGWVEDEAVHAVAAFEASRRVVYIITAYRPDEDHFGPDRRTRRTQR